MCINQEERNTAVRLQASISGGFAAGRFLLKPLISSSDPSWSVTTNASGVTALDVAAEAANPGLSCHEVRASRQLSP
jgi:hypothetical protein